MNRRALRTICPLCLAVIFISGARTSTTFAANTPKRGGGESRYEEPKLLTGYIYARDSNRLLFKFKRVANHSGPTLKVERDFTYPDGRLAARELVIYEGNALVSYALDEVQVGVSGSAIIRRAANNPAQGSIDFESSSQAGSRSRVRTEVLRENTLIADMVGPFLASHWDALLRGEKVKSRFIVVPRTETVGFTFSKDTEAAQRGQDVLIVRMEPSSLFLSPLVDPLFFTIEQAPPHRVLKYVGRTTPKIEAGGKWKDLDAVTVFDWKSVP
jgi:hypothetical protein